MAALTATDWTVTILSDRIQNKLRVVRASMSLPTTGTYPTLGVPFPPYSTFGLKRNLEFVRVNADGPNFGTRFKWDPVNSSIRIYVATTGNELATTVSGAGTTAAEILYVEACGW